MSQTPSWVGLLGLCLLGHGRNGIVVQGVQPATPRLWLLSSRPPPPPSGPVVPSPAAPGSSSSVPPRATAPVFPRRSWPAIAHRPPLGTYGFSSRAQPLFRAHVRSLLDPSLSQSIVSGDWWGGLGVSVRLSCKFGICYLLFVGWRLRKAPSSLPP